MLPYSWHLACDVLKKQYDAIPAPRLLAFQAQYFDKIGLNMRVGLFGQEGYVTTDPKNIEAMLFTHFEDWGLGSRRPDLYPLLGEGIFTQDGKPWRHSRELLRRQLMRVQYHNLKVFDEEIHDLIYGLSVAGTGTVDLQPFFFRFTLATTTDLLFGEHVGTLGDDIQDIFASNFDYASMMCAIRLRLADFHWLYKTKKFNDACADMEQNGREAASERYPFILDLHRVLKDPALVRDQLVHVLITGRDTTACLMSWTFFLLVRHPQILAKLRNQITAVIPESEEVTRAYIARLPYLRCVINESGGPNGESPVLIRKGIGCVWSTYHMNRMGSLYGPDVNDFVPERWENIDLEKKVGFGFMPCHCGPRLHLGKNFALSEASYAIVKVVQMFPNLRLPPEIEKQKTGQEKQSLTIVITSAEGCKVLLH